MIFCTEQHCHPELVEGLCFGVVYPELVEGSPDGVSK